MGSTFRRRVDLYAALGVHSDAEPSEIRRAYRRRALSDHPDRNPDPGAQERFKRATAAYAVLGDPVRRRRYDLSRPAARPGRGAKRSARPYHPPCWVCRARGPDVPVGEVKVRPAVRGIRLEEGLLGRLGQAPRVVAAAFSSVFSSGSTLNYLMCEGCRSEYRRRQRMVDRVVLLPLIVLGLLLVGILFVSVQISSFR